MNRFDSNLVALSFLLAKGLLLLDYPSLTPHEYDL